MAAMQEASGSLVGSVRKRRAMSAGQGLSDRLGTTATGRAIVRLPSVAGFSGTVRMPQRTWAANSAGTPSGDGPHTKVDATGAAAAWGAQIPTSQGCEGSLRVRTPSTVTAKVARRRTPASDGFGDALP